MKKLVCLLFLSLFVVPVFAKDAPMFYGEQVIVTASKYFQPIRQSFSNVAVISSSEIQSSGSKTVADALRLSDGVNVKSNGYLGGIATVKIRSAASEQVLVLLDGARINSSLLGLTDLNDIATDNIDRIEIVKDPISVLYGSDAMGGVINIITKKKDLTPVSFSAKAGSFGELSGNISTSGQIGKLYYLASYNNLKSDGFRVNSDYQTQGFNLNLSVEDLAELRFNTAKSDRGNPGVPSSDTDPSSASTPFDRQKDNYSNIVISFSPKTSSNVSSTLLISQNTSDQNVHYADTFVPGVFYDDNYLSRSTGVELQNNIIENKYSSLSAGLEWRRNFGQGPRTGTHFLDNAAVYLDQSVGKGLPMSADLGVRLDKNSGFGDVINPRVAFLISGKDVLLRTSISRAFRAPTINELYWDDPSWGMFGNPNLKPETSTGVSIDLEKNFSFANISANYYQNNIENMIKWSQTAMFVWQPVNIDKAKVEGLEIKTEGKIADNASAYASYTTEKAQNLTTGKEIIYTPSSKAGAGVDIEMPQDISLSADYRYVSEVYTDSLNTTKINPYSLVDLGFSKKLGSANVTIRINNLFNETYYEATGFSPVDWKERGYPMPGRSFEISVSI